MRTLSIAEGLSRATHPASGIHPARERQPDTYHGGPMIDLGPVPELERPHAQVAPLAMVRRRAGVRAVAPVRCVVLATRAGATGGRSAGATGGRSAGATGGRSARAGQAPAARRAAARAVQDRRAYTARPRPCGLRRRAGGRECERLPGRPRPGRLAADRARRPVTGGAGPRAAATGRSA